MIERYKVDVPEGVSGDWRVERFTVTPEAASADLLRSLFSGGRRHTPAGDYTALKHRDAIIMSDTPDEIRDHDDVIREAYGDVLVTGLGIGMMLNALLLKPEVAHVFVVEKSSDVIALVEPHWRARHGARFTVLHGDALIDQFPVLKGRRFGVVWHDIWPTICTDNLSEISRLKRKFGRSANWQGAWCENECRWMRTKMRTR